MHDQAINITKNGIVLPGRLLVPDRARGVIVFAHGSGSGKESPRNILVAARLNETGFATLLLDLLTAGEKENYRQNVFDLDLLTARLDLAVDWVLAAPELRGLPIGLAGASTGAAAALNVAARRGRAIAAIVSRGGRPDLADQKGLPVITAPTLFIVGGDDTEVIALNVQTAARLAAPHELTLVPGATHVFEEPGTIEQAAEFTVAWFAGQLPV